MGMLSEYIEAAMAEARYERIKNQEPFYGEIPPCRGVWATGMTLAACKRNLRDTLEDWLFVRISKKLPIPRLHGKAILPLMRVRYAKIEAGQLA